MDLSCRERESKSTVSSQRSDARHPVSWIQLMAAGRCSDRSAVSRTCTIHAVGSGFVSMIARQVEERAATGARSLRSGWDEGQHVWTGGLGVGQVRGQREHGGETRETLKVRRRRGRGGGVVRIK